MPAAIAEMAPGVHAFASAREHAWHRLGTVLDHGMTAEEGLAVAHLNNWNVRKITLAARDVAESAGGAGRKWIKVPDRFATVYTNPLTGEAQYLGVVGTHYDPFQNEWTVEFLDALSHESGGHYETMGAIFDGRRVFFSLKLPEGMLVGGVDPIDLYLMASNWHDGNGSFRGDVTPIRPVCANTVAAAIKAATASVLIRHTKGSKAHAVAEAQRVLGLTFKYEEAFQKEAEALIAKQITDDQFQSIIDGLLNKPEEDAPARTRNAFDEHNAGIRSVWENTTGTMDGITGTAWGGYQSVTEYTDHLQPVRTKGDENTARALRAVVSQNTLALKSNAWKAFAAA